MASERGIHLRDQRAGANGTVDRVLRWMCATHGFDQASVARRAGDDWVVLMTEDRTGALVAGDVLPWVDTFCARMAEGSAPRLSTDVGSVPAYVDARDLLGVDVSSVLSLPLEDEDGSLLGTLCATSRSRLPDLHAHTSTFEIVAQLLAALLREQLRAEEATRVADAALVEAETDALTGLGNRRHWERVLASEERRCRSSATPAAVVMVDIDGLKEVNDRDGHAAGDELIRRAAIVLRAMARTGDTVARLGGDEFAVLISGCGQDTLEAVRLRVSEALATAGVSASVGAAAREATGTLDGALLVADRRMYRAKHHDLPASIAARLGRLTPTVVAEMEESTIGGVLEMLREHIRMDVAFVGEFVDGRRVFRHVSSEDSEANLQGASDALEDSYCLQVAEGDVPTVMRDVRQVPSVGELAVTDELGIGAYLGVPIILSDGTTFGTLCAFAHEPRPDLVDKDGDMLAVIAGLIAQRIEQDRGRTAAEEEAHERIRRVLDGGEVVMHYQPLVDLGTDRTVGYEALARFTSEPVRSPDLWFAEADTVGLGTELEFACIREALVALPHLPDDVYLSVNVSATSLCDTGLTAVLAGVDPRRVVLEITEHTLMDDRERLSATVRQLRSEGYRIAMDDAGSGYAGLERLLRVAPDIIKLDRSLCERIDVDASYQAMVAAIAGFASAVGATVLAEGIETAEQREGLRRCGVRFGQGWLLGRPVPAPWTEHHQPRRGGCGGVR